ncbi:TonB-dependent receptor [Flammeovirga agarivorans]|uniref:TonB-dependent receptor n=1 Tax=Flammeovirga agarivorans TaxID=2726742 RepID=A0A7X8XWJ5_9BACT|nr:TonB-dependent receptor [Flammeovirga agarivorans]NLR92284.1 TonB-dependent receptor [Flammeovirga agarivorans]
MRTLILLLLSCLIVTNLLGQSKITGHVQLNSENAIGALVFLDNGEFHKSLVDENGEFYFENVHFGKHTLEIKFLGAKAYQKDLDITKEEFNLNISLEPNSEVLGEVTVIGESESTKLQQEPITISSLDIKSLDQQSLGAQEILKQTTGVVVRELGGLGSNVNVNLNGLTGKSVRIYYDGIPLEIYGGGIQLNNLPVDMLSRMDIYKGVMPVDVGTDALGGGINMVPKRNFGDFLNVSYSIGSYNTQRATFSAGKKINNHISLKLSSFLNYSDNDYVMRKIKNLNEEIDKNGFPTYSESVINARRFHDQHFSTFVDGSVVFQNFSWANELSLSVSYSKRDDQLMNGPRLYNTAAGEAERGLATFSERIDYRKKFFNNRLELRYFGVFSQTTDYTYDSTMAKYNWKGELFSTGNGKGSELASRATLREGENFGTAHRVNVKYELSESLTFKGSNFFRYSEIKGNDPAGVRLDIGGNIIDPNTIPSNIKQNIFGAELAKTFFNKKITLVGFFKNYTYHAKSIDILADNVSELPIREVNEDFQGYGLALKYKLLKNFLVRGSYEKAARIPTEREIFGDYGVILPNYQLKPERSNNFNLGLQFNKRFNVDKKLILQAEGFIRNREDLIRLDDYGPENAIFVNESKVDGYGIELSTTVVPVKNLSFNINFTKQTNKIQSTSLNQNAIQDAELPNIPTLFYNINTNYRIENILVKSLNLNLFANYIYTGEYSINEVRDIETANPDFIIPAQHLVNTGLTVEPAVERLSVNFTVRNALNRLIYDNFRVPRPGINYALKVSYHL